MHGTALAAVLAALVLPAAVDGADEPVREVRVYGGLVSLEVPASWSEIPPEVLEFYSLRSAEASGGRTAEVYQHGFRLGEPEADFAPPQILIQIRESGRVPYGSLLHLPPAEVLRERSASRLDALQGPFLAGSVLNQASFDRARFALRVDSTLDLALEGTVLVRSTSFLTERGTFTLHCYSLLEQNTRLRPVYDRVLASVRLDDALRYRPRLADRLPRGAALAAYAVAVVLAVAIIVVRLARRRRQPS
jgi:hypothetical protein